MLSTVLNQRPAFCRFNSSLLITSTYQLDSESDSRAGSLHFLDSDLSQTSIVQTAAGVFRFEVIEDTVVSALTDGSLHFFNLKDNSTRSVKVADEMLLNVAVSLSKAAVTTNRGTVSLLDVPSGVIISSWAGHKLPFTNDPCEVWSVALSGNNLCTGGEDATLIFWDLRTSSKTSACKLFEAGVTYARWRDDNVVITGSYDQSIRLLDTRSLRTALVETPTAGGVWHIESRGSGPSEQHLAACMYGGFALLDSDWNIIHQNEEAGRELLYGVSFIGPSTIACTTFNDYRVSTHQIPC